MTTMNQEQNIQGMQVNGIGSVVPVPSSVFENLMERAFKVQDQTIAALQAEIAALRNGINTQVQNQVQVSKKGGRHVSQPQIDTKTGVFYNTKAHAGIDTCEEYGISKYQLDKATKQPILNENGEPKINTFVWYEVQKVAGNRFRAATPEEIKIRKMITPVTEEQKPAEEIKKATETPVESKEIYTDEDIEFGVIPNKSK